MSAAHKVIADWLESFGPSVKAAGKPFDKDMEAASLALALDACGFAIVPKEPTKAMLDVEAYPNVESTRRNLWSAMIRAARSGGQEG